MHDVDQQLNDPVREKTNIWVLTRSDTNRAVQSQKMVKRLDFFI